ncbi:MAG: lipase family protein [Pseudomonadota bacterium]|nr:lipase family protein [Pseudomonadota bacterium]
MAWNRSAGAWIALLASLMLAACSGGDAGSDGAGTAEMRYPPTANDDAFYAQPQPMPQVPPGTILNSRAVRFAPYGVPLPNPAWQLQYMSADLHGKPQAAIATVVKPLIPSLTGGAPLLSYQFAINSAGLKCAPSHQVTGSRENLNSQLEALQYLPLLEVFGWTLVFPDHLGPASSVAVGRIAAPIVLDGIRAAESFEPLGLDGVNTPVGMMGYSGGALATTWSAALQPDYAPELNLVGVAAGGLPANAESLIKAFDGTAFFDIAFGAIISINRVFPQLLPPGLLNAEGERAANAVKDGCLGGTTDGSPAPGGHLADYVTSDDVYATPGAQDVMPQLSLPQPGEVPTAEMYFYHQRFDQLALAGEADKVADAWCEAGARIHYYKDLTGEHFAGAVTAAPSMYLYLASRFSNLPVTVVPVGTQSCN